MRVKGEYHANVDVPDGARALGAGVVAPFDRTEWFALLKKLCFVDRDTYTAAGTAGQTTVYVPLMQDAPEAASSLAHWYNFSWRPLIVGDAEGGAAALGAAARAVRGALAQMTLTHVPGRDGSRALLEQALRGAGWQVIVSPQTQNHWLDVGDMDFDAYWAVRPGALRNTFARKAKKGVVDIALFDRFDAGAWAAYEAIYAQSWKPAEGNPDFLRAFAQAEGEAGRIRFGLATIDGTPVAAQFWTVENGVAYIHKLAHVEDSLKASPGTLLSHALFRRVIDGDTVQEVNFGTGDDAYKRDWMNRCDTLWRIAAYNPRRVSAWLPMLRARTGEWKRKRTA